MAGIWRDSKFIDLAKRLVDDQTNYCGQKIFPTYLDLMIFAGMIGFHEGKNSPVDYKDALEIRQSVFENQNMDAYVYLCALQDQKSAEIFREKNEADECWKIFESYANTGLETISNWLLDSPGDIDGVETILNEIKTVAASMKPFVEPPDPQGAEF
jgi:dnd system-associated protein 4